MRRVRLVLVVVLFLFAVMVLTGACFAQGQARVPAAVDDIRQFPSCKYCGMHRAQFAFSRIYIEYDDGNAEGFCSIHCAAVDLAVHIDRFPKAMLVGDYSTKQLIDAEKALWVIGGGKPGVMTGRAKWAFEKKRDAETFIAGSGGQLAGFDEAMKATYEDMYQDTKMIRDRRAAKRKAMDEQRKKEQPGK